MLKGLVGTSPIRRSVLAATPRRNRSLMSSGTVSLLPILGLLLDSELMRELGWVLLLTGLSKASKARRGCCLGYRPGSFGRQGTNLYLPTTWSQLLNWPFVFSIGLALLLRLSIGM
ncbi:hypothetical protein LINPERPRIM_LOCUS38144 [Linum perenne]